MATYVILALATLIIGCILFVLVYNWRVAMAKFRGSDAGGESFALLVVPVLCALVVLLLHPDRLGGEHWTLVFVPVVFDPASYAIFVLPLKKLANEITGGTDN